MQKYNHKLGIASITTETGIRCLTLVQQPGVKKASINAYLGARYSRSADSVEDLAEVLTNKEVDAAAKLEKIFQDYGHKSVGDMAQLFVCVENVPMLTAMRFFYLNSTVSGQERSTRYQNFSKPCWQTLSDANVNNAALCDEYNDIMQKQLDDYSRLLEPTKEALARQFKINKDSPADHLSALKARTYDCVRHLIPMGVKTNFAGVMSARAWSEYIAILKGSEQHVETVIGDTLLTLLSGSILLSEQGFVAEADTLIRHTSANRAVNKTVRSLLELLQPRTNVTSKELPRELRHLLKHLCLLKDPSCLNGSRNYEITEELIEELGRIIFSSHSHHLQLGNVAQSGEIELTNWTDLGTIKDLNRHRSLEKFIPFLEDTADIKSEVSSGNFTVCDYLFLEHLETGLCDEYYESLFSTYDRIFDWYRKAKHELPPEIVLEYTRYLLPHAHRTAYCYYGSIDDLQYVINLRTRPGGHINYRTVVYKWLEQLAESSVFWNALVNKIPKVDVTSKEQFIDRS